MNQSFNKISTFLLIISVCVSCSSAAPTIKSELDYILSRSNYVKRSPYLRLDELATKIYLAKNKLGGGFIDPLEIGKRSDEDSSALMNDDPYDDTFLQPKLKQKEKSLDDFIACLLDSKCISQMRDILDSTKEILKQKQME